MKKPIVTMGLLALLGAAPVVSFPIAAQAGNAGVETALQSSGDLSMFYQALLTTGVINELNEQNKYTVFAPVNASFEHVPQQTYPCFYHEHCRPQIASFLRNHILVGRHTLQELVSHGSGVQSGSGRTIHVEEAYVGDYTVEEQKILTEADTNGSIVYRIDGVIASPNELAQFHNVSYAPSDEMPAEQTIIKHTYYAPDAPGEWVGGSMTPDSAAAKPESTTIIHTYTTQSP